MNDSIVNLKHNFIYIFNSVLVICLFLKFKRKFINPVSYNEEKMLFEINFQSLNDCFRVFKEKCPRYCMIKINGEHEAEILAINSALIMKKLLNYNIKSHYQLLKSELKQPFLVLQSKIETKMSQFEYEFYVKPLMKRKFLKKFFNEKLQKNFLAFLLQSAPSGRNFFFEKNLDNFVVECSITYLKQSYGLEDTQCFDDKLQEIITLSLELNEKLTLSLLLRRLSKKNNEQEQFTNIYKNYLHKIEQLVKLIHVNCDLNSFNIFCLHIRQITFNIRMSQVFLKELLYEAKKCKRLLPIDTLRRLDFFQLENLWSLEVQLMNLIRFTFLKIRQFDLFKADALKDTKLFNDVNFLQNENKNLFILFNLSSLNSKELDSLFEYYTSECFNFDLAIYLFMNILLKVDIDRIQFEELCKQTDFKHANYLKTSFKTMRLYAKNYINYDKIF